MLSAKQFFRIHKANIINLSYVTKYLKGDGGEVVMVGRFITGSFEAEKIRITCPSFPIIRGTLDFTESIN